MFLRRLKVKYLQIKYYWKMRFRMKHPFDIISTMKAYESEMLEANRKGKQEDYLYNKGRYEALKWIFKEK